ncbi:hypothetical protein [Meiothermus rufus]|nr:hypothetical protein [Meiothermus rufus]
MPKKPETIETDALWEALFDRLPQLVARLLLEEIGHPLLTLERNI